PYRPGSKGLHLLECLAQAESAGDTPERTQAAFVQFKQEWEALQREVEAGGDLARILVVLNDAEAEKRVAAVILPKLEAAGIGVPKKQKSGLFGALSRMFSK
ncbi:MAG: hypothetical protein K9M98_05465, partial [Cephaloticoccus sp.]|nr:hypothetical protein [Cephaloticoccus sp.]